MRFCLSDTSKFLVASAMLAGCSAADGIKPDDNVPMTVSFSAVSSTGASASSSPATAATRVLSITSGSDVLTITNLQLVVARLELQRAGATCASTAAAGDDDMDEHECAELELAPTVIDIPVDGTIVSALNTAIPAGTYSALEAKIRPVRADGGGDHGRGSSSFLTAHPDLAGVSVRVTGTFNGTPFTYTGAPKVEVERVFDPPFSVDATHPNLTVNADLSNWFKSQSGALIDPATATAGSANGVIVSDNIRRSFKAFRDGDHDGRDDDGDDDHGDDGPGHT
jgi:hypothetical protein